MQFLKRRSDIFLVIGEWADGHHTENTEILEGYDISDQFIDIPGITAGFLFLTGRVHLNQDILMFADRGSATIQLVSQMPAINRLNDVKESDGIFGFVALQVADEMPCRFGSGSDQRQFFFCLLHAVLAEMR